MDRTIPLGLAERRNKIYPINNMKPGLYGNDFFVHNNIGKVIEDIFTVQTTYEIIYNDMDNYTKLITDDNKRKIIGALHQIYLKPNDLHDLVQLIKKDLPILTTTNKIYKIKDKISSLFSGYKKPLNVGHILSQTSHSSLFVNLNTSEQETIIRNIKPHLTTDAYEKIQLHRDIHKSFGDQKILYHLTPTEQEEYRKATINAIKTIPDYDNNLLNSIINHPQYQTIWKPLLTELHQLSAQKNIAAMYHKAIEFIQSHDYTLVSADTAHFIFICLHCNNEVRPILRSIFNYFGSIAEVYKLKDYSPEQKKQYRHQINKTNTIQRIKFFQKHGNRRSSGIFDEKTNKEDIINLDMQGLEKIAEHYTSYRINYNAITIPLFEYQGKIFHFEQFYKDKSILIEEEEIFSNFCNADFNVIYQTLQQEHIQHLHIFHRLKNYEYSLEDEYPDNIQQIKRYMNYVNRLTLNHLNGKQIGYLKLLDYLRTPINDFYGRYDNENTYPSFLTTSDPGHGMYTRNSAAFWGEEILGDQKNIFNNLSQNPSSDNIIILEDDKAQADKYLSTIQNNDKSAKHITTAKDIVNYLKTNENQLFLLDLQQPDDELGGLHAIESIITHREQLGRGAYTNRIRIHLWSASEEIDKIYNGDFIRLNDRGINYDVFVSFGKKEEGLLNKILSGEAE